jgi:CheY-like chemotaxis protein
VSGLRGGDGNVLVTAEDRRLLAEFETALAPLYNVWTATSGRQALDVLNNEVDVLVVAPETTDMSGAEVISRARDRGVELRTAAVGRGGYDDRFDGWVRTPVTPDRIAEAVEGLAEEEGERRVFGGYWDDGNPVAEDYEDWRTETVGRFEGGRVFDP